MRTILFTVVGTLVVGSALAAGPVSKRSKIFDPCDRSFKLSVSVLAAQGVDAPEPIGFSINYDAKRGMGQATRTHTEETVELSEKKCRAWGKRNWDLLTRVLNESKRGERAKMTCRNVASIEHNIGRKAVKSLVCLGNSRDDVVAHAFTVFYESSNGLVAR